MQGLWIGWIIGLLINSLFSLFLLLRNNRDSHHSQKKGLNAIREEPEQKESEDFISI